MVNFHFNLFHFLLLLFLEGSGGFVVKVSVAQPFGHGFDALLGSPPCFIL
jgi:hypothetical protein